MRVVQEALANAARHGPAEHLNCSLMRAGDELLLTLEDDGRVSRPVRPGTGLSGMRERLEALGGALTLGVSPRGGLKLVARLPAEPVT